MDEPNPYRAPVDAPLPTQAREPLVGASIAVRLAQLLFLVQVCAAVYDVFHWNLFPDHMLRPSIFIVGDVVLISLVALRAPGARWICGAAIVALTIFKVMVSVQRPSNDENRLGSIALGVALLALLAARVVFGAKSKAYFAKMPRAAFEQAQSNRLPKP